MRIDDECRDPDLLAAEVRRLKAVIAAGDSTLTDEEREAVQWAIDVLVGIEDFSPGAVSADASAATTLSKMLERLK